MNMKLILGAAAGLVALIAIAFFAGLFSSGEPPQTEQTAQAVVATGAASATASNETAGSEAVSSESSSAATAEPQAPAPEISTSGGDEATAAAQDKPAGPPGGATRDIGWMHGNCLVAKEGLAEGRELTVITLGDPQTVIRGEIKGPVTSDEDCRLLDGLRRENNKDQGAFYVVETRTAFDYAAAVIHPEGRGPGPDPTMLDVDENDILDTFTSCMTRDGMRFSVWAAEPYNSQELWRGDYALEGDKIPTCP